MAKPPIPLGSWGEISTWVTATDDNGKPIKYKSQAKFRDHDGRVRQVSAYSKTKTATERALLKKLQDRAKTNRSGELTAMHKINYLLDLWEKRFESLVADGKRSPTSLDTYRRALKNHIRPALGELRIGEATTPRIDTVLSKIKTTAGAPTAKDLPRHHLRRHETRRPLRRDLRQPRPRSRHHRSPTKNPPRALTTDEVRLLRTSLATDHRATEADLPDLVTFMLATGVRIGESLAVLWHQINLEAGTVEITHTIARIRGEGLIRKATKSKAGERRLHLPDWAIAMLRARHAAGFRLDAPVFADTHGGFRDPSNARRALSPTSRLSLCNWRIATTRSASRTVRADGGLLLAA